jgi:hypothetical protein
MCERVCECVCACGLAVMARNASSSVSYFCIFLNPHSIECSAVTCHCECVCMSVCGGSLMLVGTAVRVVQGGWGD